MTGRVHKKHDTWAYTINLARDEVTGKYRTKTRTGFRTKAEAAEGLRAAIAELGSGDANTTLLVSQYLQDWLRASEGRVAPRTLEVYGYTVEHYINPLIGKRRLTALQPHHIQSVYAHWAETLQPSTVHRIHRTLRAALNRAVKMGYLKESPMVRVDAPANKIPRRSTLTVPQALDAIDWLRDRHPVSHMGVFLAVYTGMRRGEIAGLRWSDVLWDEKALDIRRTRQRIKGVDIVGAPKTEKSARVLPVGDNVLKQLREWRKVHREATLALGLRWRDDRYVLMHPSGDIYDPGTIRHDLLKAQIALDIPRVSFHDLRHTHATLMLQSGVPLKTVSERLGHSTITLTADTYAHVTQAMHRDALDKFEDIMNKKS